MGLLSKFKETKEEQNAIVQGRVEEYMNLIRVYYQAVVAVNHGITNPKSIPEMMLFKRTLKIPTAGGRLGVAEKAKVRKMLMELYGLSANFFNEIDASLKKSCKKTDDVQTYMSVFQGFSQNLMYCVITVMGMKVRIPAIFRKTIFHALRQAIKNIFDKEKVWKKEETRLGIRELHKAHARLNYSEQWMTEYLFPIMLIVKHSKRTRL